MSCVNIATGQELKEGDIIDHPRRGEAHVSHLDPKNGLIFLIQTGDRGDRDGSKPYKASQLGYEFRPESEFSPVE